MPYTPPSQRSPAASTTPSPSVSRTNSYAKSLEHPVPGVGYFSGPRPGLPRSSSHTYLHKERRSPAAEKNVTPSPDLTPVLESGDGFPKSMHQSGSLRQSPPPVNNNLIPTGAVISPPDSTQNSSDDDEEQSRGRSRRLEDFSELQAAVSAIEQRREGSPDRNEGLKPKLTVEVTSPSPQPSPQGQVLSPPLSREQRKISHSRSNTESSIIDAPRSVSDSPDRSSDEGEDLEIVRAKKPPMLRKKSGELVKPALRPSSTKRRPSSMPGTPTYNKQVHFGQDLEHVREFTSSDRPAAVSAGSSPVDPYDSESEFPFESSTGGKEAPWVWEIKTPNFPGIDHRKHQPVMVERVFLSSDKKFLVGSVIVKNWGFHKSVVSRFTLDYWKTTSEVGAEYSHDIRKDIEEGHDRFMFNIKLADQTNLESKTLFFCVRYNVNGQEFWDSNNGINFQVEFSKKNVPVRGKGGMTSSKSLTSLSSLPRSGRPQMRRSVGLPTPDDFDQFSAPFSLASPPGVDSLIGEDRPVQLKLRQKSIVPGSFGVQSKANQAFSTRYDFGASLSAAKVGSPKGGSPVMGDLQPSGPQPGVTPPTPAFAGTTIAPSKKSSAAEVESPPPAALSSKPSLNSQAYDELVNKYCFFGTPAKSSPSIQRPGNGRMDGSGDSPQSTETTKMEDAAVVQIEDTTSANSSALASPLGPRAASPLGYPFPASMSGSLFDPQTPTAILS